MNRLAAAIILGAMIPCAGLSQAQPAPKSSGAILDEIAAKVNNDIILRSDVEKAEKELREELSQQGGLTGAQLEAAFNDRKKSVLGDLISESLVLQIAKEQGLTAELEVAKAMEQMRQERKLPTMEALESAIVAAGYTLEEFKDSIRKRA